LTTEMLTVCHHSIMHTVHNVWPVKVGRLQWDGHKEQKMNEYCCWQEEGTFTRRFISLKWDMIF